MFWALLPAAASLPPRPCCLHCFATAVQLLLSRPYMPAFSSRLRVFWSKPLQLTAQPLRPFCPVDRLGIADVCAPPPTAMPSCAAPCFASRVGRLAPTALGGAIMGPLPRGVGPLPSSSNVPCTALSAALFRFSRTPLLLSGAERHGAWIRCSMDP